MREYVCQIRGKESINKNGSFNWMIKLDFYDFFLPISALCIENTLLSGYFIYCCEQNECPYF